MKQKLNYVSCITLLYLLLVFTGCKKEIENSVVSATDVNQLLQASAKNHGKLERWQGLDDGYLRKLLYNDKGLVDRWTETHPWYDLDYKFTFKYDNNDRLTAMNYYDHDLFLYTVVPVYLNGVITKELWYVAGTNTLDDKVVNTYNAKGQIIKRESLNYEIFTTIEYDSNGNELYEEVRTLDGILYQSDLFGYDKAVKEPMTAVPGIPYGLPFINLVFTPLHFTYLKETYEDENGNLVTYYELDPKSNLVAGLGNYAVFHNTFDLVSQLQNRQIWHYENDEAITSSPAFIPPPFNNKHQRQRLLTIPQIKEKVLQMKKQKK